MTKQEVLNSIQQFIIQNGNNEITADILRPILVDILEQPNELVGVLANLNTDNKVNIVSAINDVLTKINDYGLPIHTGNTDPNISPPPSFNLGDFYYRVQSGVFVGFYQFNGNVWVEIKNEKTSLIKGLRFFNASTNVQDGDYTLVFNGSATVTPTVNLPSAAGSGGRVLIIRNNNTGAINFNTGVMLSNTASTNSMTSDTFHIQSSGSAWYKIN